MPLIQQWIRLGTTIISNCWRTYNKIQAAGFTHQIVNHHNNFVDPTIGAQIVKECG